MSYEQILYEQQDDVALVTLNRPEKLNAWTPHMGGELADAFERANADHSIGAIVVTGAGRGFCAGADMQDTFQKRIDSQAAGTRMRRGMPEGVDWVGLVRRSKPLIAAVNGAAVGVGMTQIITFDVILASDRAKFGMFFIKVGLVPELASSHFLVQRIGFGRASEMCLTGRLYGADEAFTIGLVERVVPHDALLEQALELGRRIAANPSPQLLLIKELLTQNAVETDLHLVQQRESELLDACRAMPEHREAVQAFLEKRPPKFR